MLDRQILSLKLVLGYHAPLLPYFVHHDKPFLCLDLVGTTNPEPRAPLHATLLYRYSVNLRYRWSGF